jgi:hypothetical protein
MRAGEEGRLGRLKAHLVELIDPKIGEHHWRIVKIIGGSGCGHSSGIPANRRPAK